MRLPIFIQTVSALLMALSLGALSGCRTLGLSATGPLTVESLGADGPIAALTIPQTTAVFRESEGVVDVIVTDLSADELRTLASNAERAVPYGVILHAHMFLNPHAGRTPISFTASNTAFTMLVLAGPDAGVYGGGGFLLPASHSPSGFSARTREATLRLMGSTDAFVDQLGSGDLQGSIRARIDTALTEDGMRLIAGAIQQLPAIVPPAPE